MALDDLSKTLGALGDIDLGKLGRLAQKVDLGKLLRVVSEMDAATLQGLMKMVEQRETELEDLPDPNGDFYDLDGTLTDDQRQLRQRIRSFMENEVEPDINEYWAREEFPRKLLPKIRQLGLLDAVWTDDGERTEDAALVEGIATMEMARTDVSVATFIGVQMGLVMMSVYLGGDEVQRKEWLPKLKRFEVLGAFGLTEPEVGSGVAQGLRTTARRDGDDWILNGEKYWIGNATFCDVVVVWAKSEEDGEVKGFLVPTDADGYTVTQITGKIALRAVENGHVVFDGVRVPESHRLQKADDFGTTAAVLRATRAGVAWQAVGAATGAYEKALAYTQRRKQFGRPIASFQLVQNHLVQMLADVTAMQHLCARLSRMQDAGTMRDEHASLAKVYAAARCRDVVARAREVLGGNGILLENDVARFFADAEAIYSYEGTNEINSLVVGRAITGLSAFV